MQKKQKKKKKKTEQQKAVAASIAEAVAKVKETGAREPLPPMPAWQRLKAHQAAEATGLQSRSEGEGAARFVVLLPAPWGDLSKLHFVLYDNKSDKDKASSKSVTVFSTECCTNKQATINPRTPQISLLKTQSMAIGRNWLGAAEASHTPAPGMSWDSELWSLPVLKHASIFAKSTQNSTVFWSDTENSR